MLQNLEEVIPIHGLKLEADRQLALISRNIFVWIQFYVPFKIISAHMRRANRKVGRKRENPEKNHLAHPQADHMWPVRGSNEQQTQR